MGQEELDAIIKEQIARTRDAKFGFDDAETIARFKSRISYLKDTENHISVAEMLAPGKGHVAARAVLKDKLDINEKNFLTTIDEDGITDSPDDVKGVYVWFCEGSPFYVGIGGNLINRLYQHVKHPNHNSASMAFKIARLAYGTEMDQEGRPKTRGQYSQEMTANVQEWLLKQHVAICEITDDDELAAFEIYCAIKLDTVLNTFETH